MTMPKPGHAFSCCVEAVSRPFPVRATEQDHSSTALKKPPAPGLRPRGRELSDDEVETKRSPRTVHGRGLVRLGPTARVLLSRCRNCKR